MQKKRILSWIIVFLIFVQLPFLQNTVFADASIKASNIIELKPYDDVRGKDLSRMDFRGKNELLYTLSFDTNTKWPNNDKMPEAFNPNKVLEYGKDPGLGIKNLHNQGYTGAGVNIAYIDQPILEGHQAYSNVNLKYYKIRPEEKGMDTSMHGPAVISLLAGDKIGVAPNANVYFLGHPAWLLDQRTHAEALYKLIKVNKTLPEDKKIRIVGFSDCPDEREKYIDNYKSAIMEAEKNGIMVIDVTTLNYVPLFIKPTKDKNNFLNYEVAQWYKEDESNIINGFYVPTSARTTATGARSDKNQYQYDTNGGLSWGVPYVVGTIALGLQINPNLTKEQAVKYLYQSGYDFHKGKMINPEGFINMVKENCTDPHDVSLDKDYRYFLYNKNKVTIEDLQSINNYLGKFNDGIESILIDVSEYANAVDIYDMLKKDSQNRIGKLKGIQIFGTSKDVPAFDIHFKIQMKNSIDDSGSFKSDFFYSNFKSNSSDLENDFSIYKAFNNKLNVSFIPEWTVSRLPLVKGEIAPYMTKNSEYVELTENKAFGNFVNFSNPIFASNNHSDDFGYFLKEKMDKEFNILSSNEYKLYGNKQGKYPVSTDVIGDFTKENIKNENKKGIMEFILNTHGQWNNIDQCIYTTKDKSSEKRISFLNKDNINDVLSANYYDLDLWTCSNGYNLDDTNLVHEAMGNGNCMSAMAASSIISNNGVHNDVSLENMKKNNFYYFYYKYLYNRAIGNSRSESFNHAEQAYAQEILKNTDMLLDGNYQFNLHNLLSYHYFGLIEYWNSNKKNGFNPKLEDGSSGSNNQFDVNITFKSNYSNGGFKVNSLKAKSIGEKIEFTINYQSSRCCDFSFFNPPNGNKIKKIVKGGIKKGTNTAKFSLNIDEFNKVLSVNSITMVFGFDNKSSFIEFRPNQLDAENR